MSSVEMAVEDTIEKEPMGMRTKNNWRKTILEPDDESGAQANAFIGLRLKDKKALRSVCANSHDVTW